MSAEDCDEMAAEDEAWERSTTIPRMAKPSMEVNISFRVPRALRDAAREKANKRQEDISDVLRDALERYVRSKR